MPAFPGRALRIKYDSGTGAAVITGSTSDNFTINKEGINVTDKGDVGVQTFISDAVGVWSIEGGIEGFLKDTQLITLMNDTDQFTYDMELDIAGLGTWVGEFGITSFAVTGSEGAEAITFTANIVSSGAQVFTAA